MNSLQSIQCLGKKGKMIDSCAAPINSFDTFMLCLSKPLSGPLARGSEAIPVCFMVVTTYQPTN